MRKDSMDSNIRAKYLVRSCFIVCYFMRLDGLEFEFVVRYSFSLFLHRL